MDSMYANARARLGKNIIFPREKSLKADKHRFSADE
jgi:hypothetical protein